VVDLIRDHRNAQGYQRAHALVREKVACRVGRGVDHHGTGARRDARGDGVRVELEAISGDYGHLYRYPTHEPDDIRVTRIARVREDHLVPGIQHRAEQEQHGRRGPRGDDHLLRMDVDPVRAGIVCRDGLSEGRLPQRMGIVCVALRQGSYSGAPHRFRDVAIRLAHFEMHHVDPRGLDRTGSVVHVHAQKGRHLLGTAGDHRMLLGCASSGAVGGTVSLRTPERKSSVRR